MHARSDTQTKPWTGELLALYDVHYRKLCNSVARLVGEAQAEEVVQESFLKFHERQCTPRPGSEMAYLRSMALNEARSRLRRQEHPLALRPMHYDGASVEELCERNLLASHVREAASSLAGRQAQVISLRYFEGLSEGETAARLGISTGSVKVHASRARHAMRQLLVV